MANKQTGRGKSYLWLLSHASYEGDDCLKWPFSTLPSGYGQFGRFHKMHYAHRFMCELVNGPPPTPAHHAAHTCGKGHLGCVNPNHLVWKTPSENKWDQTKHGTCGRSPYGQRGALNPDQVRAIRSSREHREKLAEKYGISSSAIRRVQYGMTYKDVI